MKNLIKNSKISHKLIFLSGIPLALFLAFSFDEISISRTQVNESLRTKEAMEAFSLLDNVSHNFAVERGLTAGFLGSKGDPGIKEKLNEQRAKADAAQRSLEGFTPSYVPQTLWNKAVADVEALFEKKATVRQQVDTLSPNLSPFTYYSSLNRHAIAAASLVSSQSNSPDVSQKLSALHALITMKEKAGQSRGALNGVFASKSVTPAGYTQVGNYIDDFNFAKHAATNALVGQDLAQFNSLAKDPVWGEIAKIENQFLGQSNNLTSISGPSPQEWFPLATQRITSLNQYKNQMLNALSAQLSAEAQAASQRSIMLIVGLVVVTTLVLLLSFITISSINKRVCGLAAKLGRMSKEKDVSVKLYDGSKDEIGEIELSVDHFVINILEVITSAADLADQSEKTLAKLTALTAKDVQSASMTSKRCESLATALNQMAQSSEEVAHYAQGVEEATKTAREVTQQAVDSGEQSSRQTTELITSIDTTFHTMQELQKQTANVKEILDNITGISEQTNLLALNAAIEAARAGEMGRGFAVVADEVRNLAQRSKQSTEEIASMLEDIRKNTETSFTNMQHSRDTSHQTQMAVENAKVSLEQLGSNIDDMANKNRDITEAAQQQAQTVSSVSKEIGVLVDTSRDSSEGSRAIEYELLSLSKSVSILTDNISCFKTA